MTKATINTRMILRYAMLELLQIAKANHAIHKGRLGQPPLWK
jgi:hypothetical protein